MLSNTLQRVQLVSLPAGSRGILSGAFLASRASSRPPAAAPMDSQSAQAAGNDSAAAPGAAAALADAGGRAAPVRVAVAQMTSRADVQANYETVAGLAKAAAEQGCRMLFLPENFSFLGTSPAESLAVAEALEPAGPTLRRYSDLARRTGLWLSLGGFQERGPDPQHLCNCHVVLDSAGRVAATYRKVHLFNVDVPGGPVLMESRFTAPGDRLAVCECPAGRLGLSVCYDLRFPEVYQRLAHDLGAHILLVPSAFTVATGRAHWEVLLRARAIETQCYVIAAAQAGRHNEKRESWGHSLIVDPWGEVVARLEDGQATGIAVADIDLARLADIRARMPVAEHRRLGLPAVHRPL